MTDPSPARVAADRGRTERRNADSWHPSATQPVETVPPVPAPTPDGQTGTQGREALSDHRAEGKPDRKRRWSVNERFLIGKPGNPMMERWRLIQTPLFGIYVHFIYREDLDPVPHDHPWRFWSLVLRGGYAEIYHPDVRDIETSDRRAFGLIAPRRFHGFPLHAAHRIVHVEPRTVTLVVVGRKLRTWGFYDTARGSAFVDWRDALGIRPTEGSRSTGKYPKASS